jgi:hypothetical protein
MSSLVTVAEVKTLISTSKSDTEIQAVIDREEAEVIRLYGAHYVAATSVSETLAGGGRHLLLRRAVASVTTVTEDDAALTSLSYRVWGSQGRLERLPLYSTWGEVVVVSYVPTDDSARRRPVIIELVRLALEHSAMKSESVAGEYSYNAPEWLVERGNLLRSLGFIGA